MKNYRKKPVVIQAMQYTGKNGAEVANWLSGGNRSWLAAKTTAPDGTIYGIQIDTLEGTSYALSENDWVIKGVNGEFYPCKPDVFSKTYEEVHEEKYTPHL